jgi:predicted XRE-type DNA-binding protein
MILQINRSAFILFKEFDTKSRTFSDIPYPVYPWYDPRSQLGTAKAHRAEHQQPVPKPLVWLHGQIKTPPFTADGRQEAGMLLRLLQQEDRRMDATKRKALEAAGWKVGDAADFLEMSDEERQLLDTRVELALAIRRQREALHLSQKQLGAILKTSQPRVARIERAASDVSMDQLIRAFTAAGGKIVVKTVKPKARKKAFIEKETLIFEVGT